MPLVNLCRYLCILWGGANIGQLSASKDSGLGQTPGKLEMFNGFSGNFTKAGAPANMAYLTITVKGDIDSAFTELRIQANNEDKSANRSGRMIADISLTPSEADGDDILIGGYGNDLIYGQGGDDIIYGDLNTTLDGTVGNDVFVYSLLKDNGNDTIKDFSIAHDKLYMIDLLDAYQGTGEYSSANVHRTRYPGTEDDKNMQSTTKSDDNITIKDLLDIEGNDGQFIEVSGNDDGDVVLTLTGRSVNKGTVTLENIKYAVGDNDANTYGSVADLLGANGHKQILYVTTDSFNMGVDNDWATLTNINNTPII